MAERFMIQTEVEEWFLLYPHNAALSGRGPFFQGKLGSNVNLSHGKQPLFKNGNRPFKISISRNVSIPEPIDHAQKAEIVQKIIQNQLEMTDLSHQRIM